LHRADAALSCDPSGIVVLSVAATGNLIQDVAAVHVLRAVLEELGAELGLPQAVVLSMSQWPGRPAELPTNRFATAAAGATAAALSDVSQVVVGSLGSVTAPSDGSLPDSVAVTRQTLDMLVDQHLEPSQQLRTEIELTRAELHETLSRIRGADSSSLQEAAQRCAVDGLFSPGPRSLLAPFAVRDGLGRVRSVPVTAPGAWSVGDELPRWPRR